jgi:hypothetical protein
MNKKNIDASTPLPPSGLDFNLTSNGINNATCNIIYNYVPNLSYIVSVIDSNNVSYNVLNNNNGTAYFNFPLQSSPDTYIIKVTAINKSNLSSSSSISFIEEQVIAPQNLAYTLNRDVCNITFTTIILPLFSYTVSALDSNNQKYNPSGSNGNYNFTLINNPSNFTITVTATNGISSAVSTISSNNSDTHVPVIFTTPDYPGTKTFIQNQDPFTWTAPVACTINSISFYSVEGNNGVNINIWITSGGVGGPSLANPWYFPTSYGELTLSFNPGTRVTGPGIDQDPILELNNVKLVAGDMITVWVSTLATYNYVYLGIVDNESAIGYTVNYKPL